MISSEESVQGEFQTSLFGGEYERKHSFNNAIDVVMADFGEASKLNWKEMFDGFDELYAITYSSGIDFVAQVISKFDYAEIIFGHEGILDADISTVMAANKKTVETISKHKSAGELADRMENDSLALYVARGDKSHEKIYCMKSNQGRYRIIVGSANLSASAFTGLQRENIVCFDSEDAYSYYYDLFCRYKNECSDEVSYKLIGRTAKDKEYLDDHIEELPVIKTIENKQTIILTPNTEESEKDIQFIADVHNISGDIKPIMPKLEKKGNNIVIRPDKLREVKKRVSEVFTQKKEEKKVFPKLYIDYENSRLFFNDEEMTLSPEKEAVSRDAGYVVEYLDSLSKFNNEWQLAQENYFKFMNWFFASAFMARLRLTAYSNGYTSTLFPVVGILYGASNGGKSTFVKILMKLMTGQEIHPNQSDDFTATSIDKLKQVCQGVPIYIDDLARQQYQNHNEKIIKTDNWGIKERLTNYPAVAISTNKLPSVTPDIYKRSITCRINVRISLTDGVSSSRKVNEGIKNISTALYSEYVARMLPIIAQMEDDMKEGADNPDIFRESSETLVNIISESIEGDLPEYIRILTYDDYFGTQEIGREARKKIITAWESEPDSFKVYKRKNKLVYTFAENAYYDIKYLTDELPPNLNCQLSSRTLTMDYNEAKDFFKRTFRRGLFGFEW